MRGGDTRFKPGFTPWHAKPRVINKCPKCGVDKERIYSLRHVVHCSVKCAKSGQISPMKGRTTSEETKRKQRGAKLGIRGEDHWNWRGGCGSERKILMRRDEYVQWRKAVFARDNFTCVWCGVRGTELHADHIEPWATNEGLRYSIDNGRTLCVPCHHKTPSFPKKLIPKEMRVE